MSEGLKGFFLRNQMLIVMIPTLIGVHWGWWKLQYNETFVKKEERRENFPIVTGFKILKSKLLGEGSADE